MSSKRILIPLDLMIRVSDLLGKWDISAYDCTVQREYDDVVDDMLEKLLSMDLRQAYSKMVYAKDENKRFDARIEYLKRKNEYNR